MKFCRWSDWVFAVDCGWHDRAALLKQAFFKGNCWKCWFANLDWAYIPAAIRKTTKLGKGSSVRETLVVLTGDSVLVGMNSKCWLGLLCWSWLSLRETTGNVHVQILTRHAYRQRYERLLGSGGSVLETLEFPVFTGKSWLGIHTSSGTKGDLTRQRQFCSWDAGVFVGRLWVWVRHWPDDLLPSLGQKGRSPPPRDGVKDSLLPAPARRAPKHFTGSEISKCYRDRIRSIPWSVCLSLISTVDKLTIEQAPER